LLIGLGTVAHLIYQDIQRGTDYNLRELACALLAALFGPITLIIILLDRYGDEVVLKGKEEE
jgi:hypothetical protein